MYHRIPALALLCGALLVLTVAADAGARPIAPDPAAAAPAFINLPEPPLLSAAGYHLILDYEVGGGEDYYSRYLSRPSWPGAASGVTVGVGYDLGYNSASVIRHDWSALDRPPRDRLAAVAGVTGTAAKPLAAHLRDILIRWQLAEDVFHDVTLTRYHDLTRRTFRGFEELHPNCQAALVSVVFNRGSSMSGSARAEMRAIRSAVPDRDYREIASQIRAMKRLWRNRGLDGLLKRREAEAQLVETCLQ